MPTDCRHPQPKVSPGCLPSVASRCRSRTRRSPIVTDAGRLRRPLAWLSTASPRALGQPHLGAEIPVARPIPRLPSSRRFPSIVSSDRDQPCSGAARCLEEPRRVSLPPRAAEVSDRAPAASLAPLPMGSECSPPTAATGPLPPSGAARSDGCPRASRVPVAPRRLGKGAPRGKTHAAGGRGHVRSSPPARKARLAPSWTSRISSSCVLPSASFLSEGSSSVSR